MRQKLFTVEDTFNFGSRKGTVVTGELEGKSHSFKPGDEVILIQLDGKEISSTISGTEMPKFLTIEARLKAQNKIGVLFDSLTKEDIPIGTKVYLTKTG